MVQLIGPGDRLAVDREQDIAGHEVDIEQGFACRRAGRPADEPIAAHPRGHFELPQERPGARVEHGEQAVARNRPRAQAFADRRDGALHRELVGRHGRALCWRRILVVDRRFRRDFRSAGDEREGEKGSRMAPKLANAPERN
ncbi:MAG: hypothetical protein WKG01_36825 [Kofleriaceae bacterium]